MKRRVASALGLSCVVFVASRALVPNAAPSTFVQPKVSLRSSMQRQNVRLYAADEPEDDIYDDIANKVDWLKNQKGSEQAIEGGAEFVSPLQGLFGSNEQGLNPRDRDNYVTVELTKPLGIGFAEANGQDGAVITEFQPGSAAAKDKVLRQDYVLALVGLTPVYDMKFADALQPIKDAEGAVKLTFFQGDADAFYGKRKPIPKWMSNFIEKLKPADAGAEKKEEEKKEGDW